MYDGSVTIKTELDTKDFDKQLKEIEDGIKRSVDGLEDYVDEKTLSNETPIEDVAQLEQVDQKIEKIVTGAKKWSIALLAVNMVSSLISSGFRHIAEYDEQIKADLEYIQYALATLIKPIAEFIIKVVYWILDGINAIANALFGVNLFSEATADNFKKTNKQAKELKRTLTGFDEMNVINGDGSVGAVGSAVGPSKDLSKIGGDGLISGFIKAASEIPANINKIIKAQGDLNKSHDALQSQTERSTELTKKLSGKYVELAKSGELTTEQARALTSAVTNSISVDAEQAKKLKDLATSGNLWERTINGITGNTAKWKEEMWQNIKSCEELVYELDEMYETGQMDVVQKRDYINTLESLKKTFKELGLPIDGIQERLDKFKNTKYSIQFDAEIETNGLNKTFNKIKEIIKNTMPAALATPVLAMVDKYKAQLIKNNPTIKHAKGGIVNLPGAGVPLGYGHVAGEAGIEGVVPLTDSQQMATLGEAIGRYVNINLTNNTNLDGRTIARQVTKLQNNNDFATNR